MGLGRVASSSIIFAFLLACSSVFASQSYKDNLSFISYLLLLPVIKSLFPIKNWFSFLFFFKALFDNNCFVLCVSANVGQFCCLYEGVDEEVKVTGINMTIKYFR